MVGQGLQALLMVMAAGLLLGLVSRLWLAGWLIPGLLAPVGRHLTTFYQLLRTPGNIVHEGGHAVGFLLTGFRVIEIRFWFNDPDGRGYVQAGSRYAPWGHPLIARLVASPAPLIAGALALKACAGWLEVPAAVTSAFKPGPEILPPLAQLEHAFTALTGWVGAEFGPIRLIAFGGLALSLGLEIAPSRQDLRLLAFPAALLVVLMAGLGWLEGSWAAGRTALRWIDATLATGFQWLAEPMWWTLVVLVGLGVVLTPVRLLVGGWR